MNMINQIFFGIPADTSITRGQWWLRLLVFYVLGLPAAFLFDYLFQAAYRADNFYEKLTLMFVGLVVFGYLSQFMVDTTLQRYKTRSASSILATALTYFGFYEGILYDTARRGFVVFNSPLPAQSQISVVLQAFLLILFLLSIGYTLVKVNRN